MGTSFAFAILEWLDLSAYATTGWSAISRCTLGTPTSATTTRPPPDILTFVLSTTCWKILVSVTALVLPWLYTRRGFVSRKLNTILGVSIFVLYFVTSIFWLACFAGVVAELGGGSWLDIVPIPRALYSNPPRRMRCDGFGLDRLLVHEGGSSGPLVAAGLDCPSPCQ
ncbi:hypothetical protein N7460_007019 [Penicillium canescens]|uniref:Uncharacterized protein n=1 Tax=Penicillium canescens TaxID=5083 RepID=A0AAD6IBS2_PENCN|nr:hypothetical protein N7460_007019 [Penicillium canescens]